MKHNPHHFLLINGTADFYEKRIGEVLRSFGFHTESIDLRHWLKSPRERTVVIMDGREEGAIYQQMASKPGDNKACLAVITNSDGAQLRDVFTHFEDFVLWPCEPHELALRLDRIVKGNKKNLGDQDDAQRAMIGNSSEFKLVMDKISRISACDAPVFIEGETGTGKELAARAIHYQSPRKDEPFIPVNCGALPDSLLENELFGHEKGAFTDAKTSREGLVAQADGGTLFLDEIDALSSKAQVTLLRFLQELEYRPLGGGGVKQADIRIVSASNKSLESMVEQGLFRDDLYFRLNIIPLNMPSLRERSDDIVELAAYFMDRFRREYQQPSKKLSKTAIMSLMSYDWPGNIRELESVVHRSFLLAAGNEIVTTEIHRKATAVPPKSSLGDTIDIELEFNTAKHSVVNEFEKQYLHKLMASCQGNVSLAARRAGKERRALGKLLKKHGINKQVYL